VLVVLEARKRSYHGVFWRWINPGLPAWWATHAETTDAGAEAQVERNG
jgi:hypothetical protein